MSSKMQHSMSCEYPEGCSCGATAWNKLLDENSRLRKTLHPEVIQLLLAALIDVRDNAKDDEPAMWGRVDEAIRKGQEALGK